MPRQGISYWSDRTPSRRRPSFPSFRGDATADVVVIGGGLTGAVAAYVLAKSGMDVVLLEADRIACGATSAGIGAMLPQPHESFQMVAANAGLRDTKAAWLASRKGTLDFGAALRKLSIRGDLAPTSLVVNAGSSDALVRLRKEAGARREAGVDAAWVNARAAQAEIGMESAGAMRVHDAFLFDPVRTTTALASKAESAGARIFERSEVRRTTFTRKTADVVLTAGRIRTRAIYVATGGPGGLFAQLRRHVHEQDAYVVVTDPFTAAMRREAGSREAVITSAGGATWLRWLPDGRALFAGDLGEPVGPRQDVKAVISHTADLMYQLSLRFPAMSGLPARWGWRLPVVTTGTGLPWIGPHRNYPFHFFAMALGWHGDSLAWFAAEAAAQHFGQSRTRKLPLWKTPGLRSR